MIPESPVIEGYEDRETRLGEKQEAYTTLPALVCNDAKGVVITRWRLEEEEREEFARTGVVFLAQETHGRTFQPMTPTVFPPDVPDAAEPIDVAERFIVEFRIVPWDRKTGEALTSVESAAKVYADVISLSQAMNCVAPPLSEDPDAQVRYTVDLHARLLSEMYGADVYFRPMGARDGQWILRKGARTGAAFEATAPRRIREESEASAGAAILLDGIVDVCVIDTDGLTTVPESIAFMQALRKRFKPPFFLAGFSQPETCDRIDKLGEVLTTREHSSIEDVMSFFRSALRPRGDYCVMVKASGGSFLLATSIFEESKSN